MPIMRLEPQKSPLDAIAGALNLVKGVYGIKAESAALDKAKQDQVNSQAAADQAAKDAEQTNLVNKRQNDAYTAISTPGTKESDLEKGQNLSYLSMLANSSVGKKSPEDLSALQKMIQDPTTSGLQAKQAVENSPLTKHIAAMASKGDSMEVAMAKFLAANESRQDRNQIAVNKEYKQELGPIEGTVQAANRVTGIIDKITSADPNDPNSLKSTKLLRADLQNAVGSMFNNGKAATVHGTTVSDQSTYYGAAKDAWTKLSGSPTDTIPTALLQQMKLDAQGLKDEYSSAHNIAFQSFLEGTPDKFKDAVTKRAETFRSMSGMAKMDQTKNYQGNAGGVGLPGMSSAQAGQAPAAPSAHPQDNTALDWAKKNPTDPRSAKIFQLNGIK